MASPVFEISLGGGNHAGVTVLEEFYIELVAAFQDGLLIEGRCKGVRIPGFPGGHPGIHTCHGLIHHCGVIRGSFVPAQEKGKTGSEVGLLIFGRESIEQTSLELEGFHRSDGDTFVHGLGVYVNIYRHEAVAGGIVHHSICLKGGGKGPGLDGGGDLLGNSESFHGLHHLCVELRADMIL
ncbi:hypothetical protein SDC9_123505 [bioreactor metagenome]|uniref:Uncharacterized protein n=1 Tax=bioreactor metagenome TaxID=1076179 RepID=A0A645CHS3_9ZZZZ